jgi:hypothetical protein
MLFSAPFELLLVAPASPEIVVLCPEVEISLPARAFIEADVRPFKTAFICPVEVESDWPCTTAAKSPLPATSWLRKTTSPEAVVDVVALSTPELLMALLTLFPFADVWELISLAPEPLTWLVRDIMPSPKVPTSFKDVGVSSL